MNIALVAADEAALRAIFAGVRGAELRMADWDPALRATVLRQQFDAQRLAYRARHPDARELLILADDVPAGYAVVDRTSPVWRLLDIAIAIEHQRRGIATHVVRRWQEDASRNGSVIALSVLRSNTAARSLYDRLGFRVTEEDDTRWQMEWQG